MNIWIYAEREDGEFKKVVFQIIGGVFDRFGKDVNVKALVLNGEDIDLEPLFNSGVDVVHIKNELLSEYSSELYTKAIELAYNEHKPDILFFGNTFQGRDITPRLSAKLKVGIATDCIDMNFDDGKLSFIKPIYAGKILSRLNLNGNYPIIATIRQNTLSPLTDVKKSDGNVIDITPDISADDKMKETLEINMMEGDLPDVAEANIIISGGRGMKGSDNFKLLFELAKVLGAGLGASRVAVDEGWLPQPHQVGQTGKTVSPNLYIACGISGAIQHQAGMKSSKCIVAINKDPEADIFKIADFGIVDDLFNIIPILTEKLK